MFEDAPQEELDEDFEVNGLEEERKRKEESKRALEKSLALKSQYDLYASKGARLLNRAKGRSAVLARDAKNHNKHIFSTIHSTLRKDDTPEMQKADNERSSSVWLDDSSEDESKEGEEEFNNTEERGSFMSVAVVEPEESRLFKDVDITRLYSIGHLSKRVSAQRLSSNRKSKKRDSTNRKSRRRPLSKKRQSIPRRNGLDSTNRHAVNPASEQKKNKHQRNITLPEDFVLIMSVMTFGFMSVYQVAKRLTQRQLSLILGYGLIVFASLSKIPYIRSIEESQTAKGISEFKSYNDILSTTFNIIFHLYRQFPFVTWGEKIFLLLQDFYIVYLIWKYSRADKWKCASLTVGYICASVIMWFGIRSIDSRKTWVIPIIKLVLSKPGLVYQVYINYENKHTGALSSISQTMISVIKLLKVNTMVHELSDPLLILSPVLAFLLNFIILLQIVVYRKKTKAVLAEAHKRRNKKKAKERLKKN